MTKDNSGSWPRYRDGSIASHFGGQNYEPNLMVTKAELLQRLRNRATPDPYQHLKPRNVDHAMLDYERERRNERRIEHIDTRLQVARVGMRRAQLKAIQTGRAKERFNAKSRSPVQIRAPER